MSEIKQYFEQFKDMEPYFAINEEQWTYIKETFPKDEVKECLADILMDYELPTAELSELDAYKDFMKLKGIRWNELLREDEWFQRKASESTYSLTFRGKPQYIRRLNTGNNASNYFQQENRWGVDGTVSPGPKRTWETRKFMVTLMGGLYSLKFPKVTRNELRVCLSLRKYICSAFKPNVAKVFYEMMESENVLDFSAGWGDRFAGFMGASNTKHYVGLDPRKENHPLYQMQGEFYNKHLGFFEEDKKWEFHCTPAEDFDFTPYKNHFDMVFTSPPYFSVERYSYDDTQSWIRYKTIEEWNKNFLHATLERIWPSIKKGGYMAINIADVYGSSGGDRRYLEITNPMNDFIKSLGGTYEGCLGMEMAKRPGSVGAGLVIEEDRHRYTEEELRKHDENVGKTFCEPVWIWKK